MLHWFLVWIALIFGGVAGGDNASSADRVISEAAPAPAFKAEDQTPTGQFTTATEIKPILDATRANWVAVREYEGQDLLYVTHLLSWRCGMHRFSIAINDGPMQPWDMPPCLTGTAVPNAIRPEDGLPYLAFPLGHVETVRIVILYDDLSEVDAGFDRKAVLMP
ncbi:MAG: hypothetical protein AAFW87_05775 [Pseudomonadota bacterium]